MEDDPALTWREEGERDRSFLLGLYSDARAEELAVLGWSAGQLHDFLSMQFALRERQYRERHPGADFVILTVRDVAIGRMVLDRSQTDVELVDVALIAEHRDRGLGTALLGIITHDAAAHGRTIRLHVAKTNPALRLYRRMGFEVVEDAGLSWGMVLRPSQT